MNDDGRAVKVVLLHAFPLDETMWEPQREALAGFNTVCPRLYGRGSSIDGWAGQLAAELEGGLVVVGASMGGYCALALAALAPERVRGLMLVGARAAPDSPERRRVREQTLRLLREEGAEAWLAEAPFEAPAGLSTQDLVAATEALRDRPHYGHVIASFRDPLVVVVGSDDELVGADEARAIADSARDGRLEVIEGAGHIANRDQPERFNRVLADFLDRWR